jgi:hypothetical protein
MQKNCPENLIVKHISNTARTLNLKLECKNYLYYVLVAYLVIYVGAAYNLNITQYSPDSWAYFELSKKIFNGDFYTFNTFRSYFSAEQSTSFPFGWPTTIALASIVFGYSPLNAIYINIALTVAIVIVIFPIIKNLNLPLISGLLICSALLFYRPYANEVFSGRSMPLAILAFLIALYFHQRDILFFSGLFIGLSALVRFDFLVYALIFQIIALLTKRNGIKKCLLSILGFFVGILPWVFYSYFNFDKFWVSDNSWVAFSALPAFVIDYPATPVVSALVEPITWLNRVLRNIIPLLKSLIRSTIYFPIFIGFIILLVLNFNRINSDARYKLAMFFVADILASIPYILTGYFDPRYYILFFLVNTVLLMHVLNSIAEIKYVGLDFLSINFILIFVAVFFGLIFLSQDVAVSQKNLIVTTNQDRQIKNLYQCHLKSPKSTYIFMNEAGGLVSSYGALTGMRAAFIPSNFTKMTNAEKSSYFEFMQPYVLIDSIAKVENCISQ